jgi:hypothetical protein
MIVMFKNSCKRGLHLSNAIHLKKNAAEMFLEGKLTPISLSSPVEAKKFIFVTPRKRLMA